VDPNLTDAQLRLLIGEASQILHDRRQEIVDADTDQSPVLPIGGGGFVYEVRTSYFPRIKGHYPTLFRLEWQDGDFIAMQLESRVMGKERPTVKGRFPAKNGDVFKIVRENGEYSYQIPMNGTVYNLKQHGTYHLFQIPLNEMEVLRPFFENVEPDMFDTILIQAQERVGHVRMWLENSEDRCREVEATSFGVTRRRGTSENSGRGWRKNSRMFSWVRTTSYSVRRWLNG
jgi:DNA-directed RNA polymerase subunit H (RpoH/RPB5)